MFKFRKNIAIVASLVALNSGEYAFGSVGANFAGHEDNEGLRRFKAGILSYITIDDEKVIELKFSELVDPYCGTFDLSKCDDISQYFRITTSVEEFFKVGGENEQKFVFLMCPFDVIEQAIKSNPDHPFSKILSSWDKSKAPIGMFWRYGDNTNLSWFEYLVSLGLDVLSKNSIYDNYRCGIISDGGDKIWLVRDSSILGTRWVRFKAHF